jgi:hypothetical protein
MEGLLVVLGCFFSVSCTTEAFLARVNNMGWVRFLFCTVVGGVIWATVIGLGASYLRDSVHRPTGMLGIALAVLILCLFVTCIVILLRNMRWLEDKAERMLPGPLDPDAEKNRSKNKLMKTLPAFWREREKTACRSNMQLCLEDVTDVRPIERRLDLSFRSICQRW